MVHTIFKLRNIFFFTWLGRFPLHTKLDLDRVSEQFKLGQKTVNVILGRCWQSQICTLSLYLYLFWCPTLSSRRNILLSIRFLIGSVLKGDHPRLCAAHLSNLSLLKYPQLRYDLASIFVFILRAYYSMENQLLQYDRGNIYYQLPSNFSLQFNLFWSQAKSSQMEYLEQLLEGFKIFKEIQSADQDFYNVNKELKHFLEMAKKFEETFDQSENWSGLEVLRYNISEAETFTKKFDIMLQGKMTMKEKILFSLPQNRTKAYAMEVAQNLRKIKANLEEDIKIGWVARSNNSSR